MKYIFFGSPKFAATILEMLIAAKMPPALVVCNPDRPAGRKKILTPPATKILAQKYGLATWQPEKFTPDVPELKGKWDFFVVAAYAKILPSWLIQLPRLKTIGVHPSLLPKFRGATPIQSAILAGESGTGTSVFLLDAQVDHGPILGKKEVAIDARETHETLSEKLAKYSGELLTQIIPRYFAGELAPKEQNHSQATFTKKFSTEDGFVDLKNDLPEIIDRKIRAFNTEPGVFTFIGKGGKKIRVKLLKSALRDGKLELLQIQKEGKKPTADAKEVGGLVTSESVN